MLILLPVLIAVAGAFLAWRTENKKARHILVTAVLLLNAAVVIGLSFTDTELMLWKLTDKVTLFFRIDAVSRLFSILIACVWTAVGVYSFEYMAHEENEQRFYLFYLLTLATLMGLSYSGSLVTLYMFYELMTLLSLPLVLHEMTKEAVAAGIKYLLYSVFGASMALLGIFMYATYGESLSFTMGGVLTEGSLNGHGALMLAATFAMILGFGVKCGMFPLHGWLPTAHPVAPAPASAVLSGVITKAGVLGIIRTVYYLAGADFIRGTWVQTAWLILALCTVFMGSMLAYKEKLFKKRLAYSSVSQVSYVLTGLATCNPIGLAGALLHIVGHSLIKNTLFMTAGAVICKTGKKRVDELKGIGKEMPVTMWCFTIASAGLIGIPPTCGFISKWYIAEGALGMGIGCLEWIAPCVLLISAILTAGYLLPITIDGFFPGADYDYNGLVKHEPTWVMLLPLLLLTCALVLCGVFPGAIAALADVITEVL